MRVLFTCIPQSGHVTPLVPLARAMSDQGHDVIVASGPDAQQTAVQHDLPFQNVAPPYEEWFTALRARTRGMPGDGLAPERVEKYFLPRLFGEIGAAAMLDGLLDLVRTSRPDLIVFDPVCFAAPLVGAIAGTPAIHHTVGPLIDPEALDLVADAISPTWREFGLSVPRAAGLYSGTTITICPPSLDPAASGLEEIRPMRPVALPFDQPPAIPIDFGEPTLPLVYITLGTFSNNLDMFRLICEALAEEKLNLVVTIGVDKDPSELDPLPANIHVERFIPQHALLPHCDAVVHHAGAGTTFGVLAHALPSVALPQSADNFTIAGRLASTGAGKAIMPNEVTAEAISAGLNEILQEPSYKRSAEQIAIEIAGMPSPEEVARSIRL